MALAFHIICFVPYKHNRDAIPMAKIHFKLKSPPKKLIASPPLVPPITPTSTAITPVEYGGLQAAFDHFNKELFDGKLPNVLIAYQRKARMAGHFAANRYSKRIGKDGQYEHELALNPVSFIGQTDKQICQTPAHEMAHVWQFEFGNPGRAGYHNKEWAAKMKEIGLMPSSTGMVGGKETGQHMSDYIIPGGRFEQAFEKLVKIGWKLNLQSTPRDGGAKPTNSKVKFTCPACGSNVWGKPDTKDTCKECVIKVMQAELHPAVAAITIKLVERYTRHAASVSAPTLVSAPARHDSVRKRGPIRRREELA
jgi:predicted SprT family Zn-dependent metalloprotease